jgi:hypothetical protein
MKGRGSALSFGIRFYIHIYDYLSSLAVATWLVGGHIFGLPCIIMSLFGVHFSSLDSVSTHIVSFFCLFFVSFSFQVTKYPGVDPVTL